MSKTSSEYPHNRIDPTKVEWRHTPWPKLEQYVFKLQKRIFKAAQLGDDKTIQRLQKTLLHSRSAKTLAVRQVTQGNRGKNTTGVDGVRALMPSQRLELVNTLRLTGQAMPTRRVWIPKAGTTEKRPLGIPTLTDRAIQALVKQALEPQWEAQFEPNSYGFRPGRSAHDAIEAIWTAINKKAKYVLDADIAKCFDRINHEALLTKLGTFPTLRRQVKSWLKAGLMEGNQLFPTLEGTPQGGVISPLLANIALHGMEAAVHRAFAHGTLKVGDKRKWVSMVQLIRYADDFVIIHEDQATVEAAKSLITDWLTPMGLELKASKTRLTIVQDSQSPFDGDWAYWGTRLGRYADLGLSKATLFKRQQGRCSFCKLLFWYGDKIETDHTIPLSKGGYNGYDNLQLLHQHCHHTKTASDRRDMVESAQV